MTPDDASAPTRDRISLARSPDFWLGGLRIRPALKTVAGDGWVETLEPRIMQVLVALARADGEPVTRDVLIECCWDGRIVGEDAIQRCIGRLRRLAQRAGGRDFQIETIPRVGYVLAMAAPAPREDRRTFVDPPAKARASVRRAIILAALAGSAVLAALLLWASMIAPRTPAWTLEHLRILPEPPAHALYPVLSHDGSLVAYAGGTGENTFRHIYIRNVTSGEALQITGDESVDIAPAWSPAGDQIAFVRYRMGRPCQILVKPVLRGGPSHLADCMTDERTEPVWSPDGRRLYWMDRANQDAPEKIVAFDLARRQLRAFANVQTTSWGAHDFALSPDGRFLAFKQLASGRWSIWVLDLASGECHQIAGGQPLVMGIAWSADGSSLFASIQRPADSAVWALRRDGAPAQRLTLSPLEFGRLASAGDGGLAAEIYTRHFLLAKAGAAAGAADAREIPGMPIDFDVSNDGRMALIVYDEGRLRIITKRPGREWLDFPGPDMVSTNAVRLSPDGNGLAFEAAGDGGDGVFVSSGDAPARLVFSMPLERLHPPAWTPDGRSLIVPVFGVGGWLPRRIDLGGSPSSQSPFHPGFCALRTFGTDIYGAKSDKPGIWRLGKSDELLTAKLPAGHCLDWTAGNDVLVFRDALDPTSSRLIVHHIASGVDESISTPNIVLFAQGTVYSAGVSGNQPIYLRSHSKSQIAIINVVRQR